VYRAGPGIAVTSIKEDEQHSCCRIETELHKSVITRTKRSRPLRGRNSRSRAWIEINHSRPWWAGFLFSWATASRKTSAARLAEISFRLGEIAGHGLNVASFMEQHSVSSLIGALQDNVVQRRRRTVDRAGVRRTPVFSFILLD